MDLISPDLLIMATLSILVIPWLWLIEEQTQWPFEEFNNENSLWLSLIWLDALEFKYHFMPKLYWIHF